jgi:hypothetical protein
VSYSSEEDALQAWVVRASGFAADKVIWDNQSAPRPLDDFITLKAGDQSTLGAFDQLTELTDLSRPAGQEIELRIDGWREFTLTIQAYTHAVTGDTCAFEVLTRVQTWLGLPSIRELLGATNLGPSFERGTVQSVPALLGTSRFEARAVVQINFFRLSSASEFTGYVAEVRAMGDLSGSATVDGDVSIDVG